MRRELTTVSLELDFLRTSVLSAAPQETIAKFN